MSCSIYPGILPWITDRVYERLVDSKIGTTSEFCRLSDDQILFKTGLGGYFFKWRTVLYFFLKTGKSY